MSGCPDSLSPGSPGRVEPGRAEPGFGLRGIETGGETLQFCSSFGGCPKIVGSGF